MTRSVAAALRADATPAAQAAQRDLLARYRFLPEDEAPVWICLGGDGFLLANLRAVINRPVAIYGLNCGSLGFLSNELDPNEGNVADLPARLASAKPVDLPVLSMMATLADGRKVQEYAINEVSVFRVTRQALKLALAVDGVQRVDELTCDGVLVSTPAGSTAYNRSAGGPVVPINAGVLALTPISPFRPRWRGAILPASSSVRVDLREPDKRPGHAVADVVEVDGVCSVTVSLDQTVTVRALFDASHDLAERIIKEQFAG